MGSLAKALELISGADHPCAAALKAAESDARRGIERARALFLKLKPNERNAALAMLKTD